MSSHISLIVGLANPGAEYEKTRHNAGAWFVQKLAADCHATLKFNTSFSGLHCITQLSNQNCHLLIPTTFMNLSGKAVNYWMKELKIAPENVLVVVDDLALPLGKLRLKLQGSSAGHNGLKSIEEVCGGQNYARLRFGIGNDYPKGRQVDFVLGMFDKNEQLELPALIDKSVELIKSFVTIGPAHTMTAFNK